MTKIAVIPDCQVRPGDDLRFLTNIGNYLEEKEPDVIVCIGDFADMPSLSSYDVGRKSFEGRRYKADVDATKLAMATLLKPLKERMVRDIEGHRQRYRPRMVLTLGNHEERIERAVNSDAKLDGTIGVGDLEYEKDWEVYPFLEPVVINGVAFAHYFITGVAGRPSTSAQAQLNRQHMSCVAGHQQGLQIATGYRSNGDRLTSIIAGSCYEHDEDYMGYQGNKHWRGMLMLHEVDNGNFDLMPVSLNFINKRYHD